ERQSPVARHSRVTFAICRLVVVGAFACFFLLAGSEVQFGRGQPKDKTLEPYINPKTKKDKAEEQLEKLKAKVKRDTTQKDHPVVEVKVYSQDVSADDLKQLLAFKTIRRIDFMTNKVSGPGLSALADLPLEHVFMPSNCPLDDEGLKSLAKLKSLKILHVPQGKYTDAGVKELAALINLEELTVSGFSFRDDAFSHVLKGMKKLRKLNANNCNVGDGAMKVLSELPEVRAIVLFGSSVTDAGYAHIGKLEKLEELRSSYGLTDKGLAELGNLKNLKKLNVWNSSVTIKGIRALPNLKNLKELDISTQRIKANEAAELRKELPNCKIAYKK
ncbi:MAG: hypothetical protein L0241_27190, partial [Planctomycetia bacterium]|nr:hypothetical protein [Planctomycetia bacterium]